MKILFGIDGIVVEGAESVPSADELCKMDKRFIYVGDVTDSQGNQFCDAFIHVLKTTEFFTITGTRFIDEKTCILKTEMHFFGKDSDILKDLYNNNRNEIYVGDVCDGSGQTGEVWHDTYKRGLGSNILFTKNEDGSLDAVEPPIANCLSVPDRFGFRLVVKKQNQPEKHFAFFFGMDAFNEWMRLEYNKEEGQEIFHSLNPDYTRFLQFDECEEFEKLPKLVKTYPTCYSNNGFLNVH